MAFRVAIDESGHHDRAPCIAAAACYAFRGEHWREFVRDWGPRAATYASGFHSTSARADDLPILAAAIGRWLHGFAITISYKDFTAAVPHRMRSQFGGEYSTAIRALVHFFGIVAERQSEHAVFVLERGHPEQEIVNRLLSDAAGDTYVWDHVWATKDNITTHAADLLAHVAAPLRSGIRSPLLDVMEGVRPMHVVHMTRAQLDESVENVYRATGWTRRHGPKPTSAGRLRKRRIRKLRGFIVGIAKSLWFKRIKPLWPF